MQPNDVRATLVSSGIALVRGMRSPAEFVALASALGETLLETRVALDARKSTYLAKPEPIPLHTDHPSVATIGWYCDQQDGEDGACLFVDARTVVDAELERALDRETLRVPGVRAVGGPTTEVSVSRAGKLFFAPWLVTHESKALDQLARRLREAEPSRVRLEAGDAVFIDNRRVLHGRGAIAPSSDRVLTRRWLR